MMVSRKLNFYKDLNFFATTHFFNLKIQKILQLFLKREFTLAIIHFKDTKTFSIYSHINTLNKTIKFIYHKKFYQSLYFRFIFVFIILFYICITAILNV